MVKRYKLWKKNLNSMLSWLGQGNGFANRVKRSEASSENGYVFWSRFWRPDLKTGMEKSHVLVLVPKWIEALDKLKRSKNLRYLRIPIRARSVCDISEAYVAMVARSQWGTARLRGIYALDVQFRFIFPCLPSYAFHLLAYHPRWWGYATLICLESVLPSSKTSEVI